MRVTLYLLRERAKLAKEHQAAIDRAALPLTQQHPGGWSPCEHIISDHSTGLSAHPEPILILGIYPWTVERNSFDGCFPNLIPDPCRQIATLLKQ